MVRTTTPTTSLGAAAEHITNAMDTTSLRSHAELETTNHDHPAPHYQETGGGGVVGDEASLKFLRVVKLLQTLKRVERIAKAQRKKAAADLAEKKDSLRRGELTSLFSSTPSSAAGAAVSGDDGYAAIPSNNESEEGGESSPTTNICGYLTEVVFGKGILSVCLLAGPLALVAVHYEWSATCIFWLSFFTMVPLASILGDFTEEVALHTNQTIGGLINATFGNAVEVVVGIQALLANEIRVVQSSMLGSIFSNLLLVLGSCFFFGGMRYKEQRFNATAASANMGLLALSGIALVLPTPFASYYELHDEHVLLVSRVAAIFLIFMYVQLLVFQLKTHADIFDDGEGSELAAVPFWVAALGLLTVTLLVTVFSEFLVHSIDGFVETSGISRTFVGIIILPIIGNAVEHVTAVTVAMKNKMDLAMGVAVGSCTQISLFVVPLTVLVGWMTDRHMTLNFPHFEVILFVLSVFTVSVVLTTASGNWLLGSLLMTTYVLIGVGFWFENVQSYR